MNPIFNKSLSNIDINKLIKDSTFRGCYMRDKLKTLTPKLNESGILNLDISKNRGTHWTCWIKRDNLILYFDSYGLIFPNELMDYFRKSKNYKGVYYSTLIVQPDNTVICGHLCIYIINSNPSSLKKFISLIHNLLI